MGISSLGRLVVCHRVPTTPALYILIETGSDYRNLPDRRAYGSYWCLKAIGIRKQQGIGVRQCSLGFCKLECFRCMPQRDF